MFEKHFQLRTNPFGATATRDLIYESRELHDAVVHLRHGLEHPASFLLLTGEVGTGKTTGIKAFLHQLPADSPVAVISNPALEPRELLEEIALRFGLPDVPGRSKPSLMFALEALLDSHVREGRRPMLIVDEAQALSPAALEELRLLSNIERNGVQLMVIVLAGQVELLATLESVELRQLRQRIGEHYHVKGLDRAETCGYLVHRLSAAGSREPGAVFTPAAMEAIFLLSRGLPREINVLAGQAMVTAFVEGSPRVEVDHVRSVREDYGYRGVDSAAAITVGIESMTATAGSPAGLESPVAPEEAYAPTPAPLRRPFAPVPRGLIRHPARGRNAAIRVAILLALMGLAFGGARMWRGAGSTDSDRALTRTSAAAPAHAQSERHPSAVGESALPAGDAATAEAAPGKAPEVADAGGSAPADAAAPAQALDVRAQAAPRTEPAPGPGDFTMQVAPEPRDVAAQAAPSTELAPEPRDVAAQAAPSPTARVAASDASGRPARAPRATTVPPGSAPHAAPAPGPDVPLGALGSRTLRSIAAREVLLGIVIGSTSSRAAAYEMLFEATSRAHLPGVVVETRDKVAPFEVMLGSFSWYEQAEAAAEPLVRQGLIEKPVIKRLPQAAR